MKDTRLHNLTQQSVQATIDELVESGNERGIQVAAYLDGELLLDAVAGLADPETGRAMTSDTPVFVASVAKCVTATVAHVLAERGALDYDAPIADLWPEFGAHGKESATLRHALTHTVGVPGLSADVTPEVLMDWDRICAIIADSEPWWEPGTRTAYHGVTYGFIVGEVVRRATGQAISQVLRDEVAIPLGMADELFLGVAADQLHRVARQENAPGVVEMQASLPDDFPMFQVAPRSILPDADYANRTDITASDIPSGGTMSARSVAKMMSALMIKTDGVRLVSPARAKMIFDAAFAGTDEVMGNPATWGLGFAHGLPGTREDGTDTALGMVGMNGTAAYADPTTGLSVAITKNTFTFGPLSTVAKIDAEVLSSLQV